MGGALSALSKCCGGLGVRLPGGWRPDRCPHGAESRLAPTPGGLQAAGIQQVSLNNRNTLLIFHRTQIVKEQKSKLE